jgi:hypothetical protein
MNPNKDERMKKKGALNFRKRILVAMEWNSSEYCEWRQVPPTVMAPLATSSILLSYSAIRHYPLLLLFT